jgi:hypothetical protein
MKKFPMNWARVFSLLMLYFSALGCLGCDDCECSDTNDQDSDSQIDDSDSQIDIEEIAQLPFEPSNLEDEEIPSDLSDLRFGGTYCENSAEINTDDCSVTCSTYDLLGYACTISIQSDGTEVAVVWAHSVSIDENIMVEIEGQRPAIIVSLEDVDIHGTLIALDWISNETGQAGGYSSESTSNPMDGNGPGGGGAGYRSAGAGGGGYCGWGGNGGSDEIGSYPPGAGGESYGNAQIIPLKGGSAGGKSSSSSGGAGGGAVQIVSGTRISVYALGVVSMPGNYGSRIGPNGGGAGGAILLEAPVVSVEGILAANGGGGSPRGIFGDQGLSGQAGDQPAQGGVNPDAEDGGNGSAGNEIDGGDGPPVEGAGGGGGAGWIRINTQDGRAEVTGIVSPYLESECVSIGEIASK